MTIETDISNEYLFTQLTREFPNEIPKVHQVYKKIKVDIHCVRKGYVQRLLLRCRLL